MRKCILTGNETHRMCKGFPCSREGTEVLTKLMDVYNDKIKKEFVAKALGRAKEHRKDIEEETNTPMEEDTLVKAFEQLAPKVNKRKMLTLVNHGVQDAIETLKEVRDGTE